MGTLRDESPSNGGENVTAATTPFADLNGLSILVVDDQADVRELVGFLLEANGARVHLADATAAALGVLAAHTPDVIISDIAMPGEDGYSLMRRVRALRQHSKRSIPAIAVTAFCRDVDRERALDAGFNLHMSKPIDPVLLVRGVADLARRDPSS
jgi:CheY-like chemotaxis protein